MVGHHELNAIQASLVKSGAWTKIDEFLKLQNAGNYALMKTGVEVWLSGGTIQTSIGVQSTVADLGVRIVIADSTGTCVYDSKSNNNAFGNIDVPDGSFLTNGSYKINNNVNTDINVLMACLSQVGVATTSRFSTAAQRMQNLMTVRVGSSPQDVVGTVTIRANR